MKTTPDVFIAFIIPKELGLYLSLYCLSKRTDKFKINRSKIARKELEKWYNEEIKKHSVESLMQELFDKIQGEWDEKKLYWKQAIDTKTVKSAFDLFKYERTAKLRGTIEDKHIDYILKNLIL